MSIHGRRSSLSGGAADGWPIVVHLPHSSGSALAAIALAIAIFTVDACSSAARTKPRAGQRPRAEQRIRSHRRARRHHRTVRVPRRGPQASGHGAPAAPRGIDATSGVPAPAARQGVGKLACAYTAHSISGLVALGDLVGRRFACALVYNDSAPDWSSWENPWFLRTGIADNRWGAWATAPGTGRQLVITQNLFPASLDDGDWRTAGAAGQYEDHARALAANLVAAGLGNSIIRLAHEANGTWYPDSIGDTPRAAALWVQFWRHTVIAMRSVPGAHFRFDWCVSAAVRPIPLSEFYPGDDVVDIVGIDAYDAGVPAGVDRWSTIFNRTDGIGEVLAFAKAHGKPLSIPEWGVGSDPSRLTGGDDPEYVNGIAAVVRDNDVAYQSYFYKYDWATQLASGPLSLAAYRAHFGSGGDSAAP